ncbi:coiled-coil domain-containing protein 66 isoform X2 [Phyllopteryx taeniolatus]|uniref:coiled-coil domain-containing protein 66 isoform X2 n=1 Tax=Phyllopteryx taeniolatus TaxID=161469 RepID=UPI002AD354D1|nr:coiled-coil domain-containing protein 66 isoform X2 [Phyllopteryx taeniolatus]
MYLGDGLLFEIQNGKPKLIVLDHSVERNLVTNSLRTRPACLVSSGQPSCAQDVRAQRRAGLRPTGRRPGAPGGAETQAAESAASFGSGGAADTMRGGQAASKTRERRTAAAGAKAAAEKSERQKSSSASVNGAAAQSARRWATASDVKSGPTDPLDAEEPRDAAARLSGERTGGHDRRVTEEQHVHRTVEEEAGGETEEGREGPDQTTTTTNNRNSPPKDNGSHGGVFGRLEQRNVDDGASAEAKKAQWRQQLDEQVALKQQRQRCSTSVRLQTEQEPGSERSVHPPGRHREQPAAIRSSLRLGAVTPMEETLASQRREEQRRLWLEDLDRQREETSQRRMREKMLLSQKDDHELWAAHFDSLQRKAPAGTRAPPADWEASANLSLTWDASGRREAASAGQVGVDPGGSRYPAKSSYHRSMTALLDPVQVEERERRRLKQLEQQRDIRAQVEEQRRHKRQEEATRRAEDREEERRVAQERDVLLGRFRREQRKVDSNNNRCTRVLNQEQPKKLDDDDEDGGVKEAVDVRVSCPTAAERRDTAVQTDAPPTQATSNCKNRAGKEDVQKALAVDGGGAYEAFARTEEKRRPEWNTRRPSRRFVPASERYPSPLQRSRRESRLKRQEEILGLQDRNCPPANRRRRETRIVASRPRSDDAESSSVSASAERGRSPLIPQPSLQFIPYIRTDDVFHLDPTETEDTPTPHLHTGARTHTHSQAVLTAILPSSSAPPPDASSSSSSPADLLILRSTQRQQEILRGLAQLRQGLLEKQRELECDLRRQDNKRPSPAKC